MLSSAHDVVYIVLWYQVAVRGVFSKKWLGQIGDLEQLEQLEFT
jgi:hypothetical protein